MCTAPPASLGEQPGTGSTTSLRRPLRDIAVTPQPPHCHSSSFPACQSLGRSRSSGQSGSSSGSPRLHVPLVRDARAQAQDRPLAKPSAGSILANPQSARLPRPMPAPQQVFALPVLHQLGAFGPTKHKHLWGVRASHGIPAHRHTQRLGDRGSPASSCNAALRPSGTGTPFPAHPRPESRVPIRGWPSPATGTRRDGGSPSSGPTPSLAGQAVAGPRQPLQGHRQGSPPRDCTVPPPRDTPASPRRHHRASPAPRASPPPRAPRDRRTERGRHGDGPRQRRLVRGREGPTDRTARDRHQGCPGPAPGLPPRPRRPRGSAHGSAPLRSHLRHRSRSRSRSRSRGCCRRSALPGCAPAAPPRPPR